MLEKIIKTSIFLPALQKIQKQQYFIMHRLYKIVIDSQTYKLMLEFQEGTRINFKYSFLGKITEINKEENIDILGTSSVLRQWIKLFNKYKYKIINCFKTSVINGSIEKLNKNLYSLPLKTAGIIIIIIVFTNIILLLFLKQRIGLFGYFLRGLFLLVGYNSLFSGINLDELSKTSYFIKRINNPCKI